MAILTIGSNATVSADGRTVTYALQDGGRSRKESGLALYLDGTGNTTPTTCFILGRDSKDPSGRYFYLTHFSANTIPPVQFRVGASLYQVNVPLHGSLDYVRVQFTTSVATVSVAFVE